MTALALIDGSYIHDGLTPDCGPLRCMWPTKTSVSQATKGNMIGNLKHSVALPCQCTHPHVKLRHGGFLNMPLESGQGSAWRVLWW